MCQNIKITFNKHNEDENTNMGIFGSTHLFFFFFFFLNQESFVKNNWGLLNWTDFSLFLWLVKQQWLEKSHILEGREPPNPVGLTLSVLEMRLRMEKGLTQGHTAS